jgi:predicted nucleic-acid-binding Zn-ribbon protein
MASELEALYAAMSDDEMRRLGDEYASLTDEGQALVRAEFKRRSLEVPEVADELSPDATKKVTTIRQYRDQAEASMARSVLQSAGIDCFLRDENTIRIDWLWSNLMGGIRLQVAEEDVEAAEAVLSEPIPDHIAVEGEADYEQPQCPKCGSLDTSFNNLDAKVGATSILLFGFPLPSPVDQDYWHCYNCGCNWLDESDTTATDGNSTSV